MAVQILRATTATRIVAIDRSPEALAASSAWSDVALSSADPAIGATVAEITCGFGADAVLDFVGIDATMALAATLVGRYGAIRIVGLNGGSYPFLARSAGNPLPRGVTIMCPYGGTYGNLADVIALAQQGRIRPMVTRFPLDRAFEAMALLQRAEIRGRAVLIP